MRTRIRIPQAYSPRSAADLRQLGSRLGGEVSLVFARAQRDGDGKLIRHGYLDHMVLEFEGHAPGVNPPAPPQRDTLSSQDREALRAIAKLAADAWAKSIKKSLPEATRYEPRSKVKTS